MIRIEWLRHERRASQKEHLALRVFGVRHAVEQPDPFARIEGADVHTTRSAQTKGRKQKVSAIRKEGGIRVNRLTGYAVQHGDRCWGATGRSDARDGLSWSTPE